MRLGGYKARIEDWYLSTLSKTLDHGDLIKFVLLSDKLYQDYKLRPRRALSIGTVSREIFGHNGSKP